MTSALLTTKLHAPPTVPDLIPRPHLLERLNTGMDRQLMLLSAPAGFGKTTLLTEWAAHRAGPVAWLSLDEGDNDPTHFLTYLVAAVQDAQPDAAEPARAALQSPHPPRAEDVLTALINRIATIPDQTVLVLDDYHLITAQPIHLALTFLLDHLPQNLHLVIATRADPPLPLARLRARGQLTELRQSHLRFTRAEAAAFLNSRVDADLSAEAVTALASRTEGWIAGLQMAALAIESHGATSGSEDVARFVRDFAGSDRYILDYLVEEVLQHQPPTIQTFLLQTSILNRLTASLCDAVRGPQGMADVAQGTATQPVRRSSTGPASGMRPEPAMGSQAILEYLESTNLFVVPLDNERRWYRYHRLLADLLRRRLAQASPDLVPHLHRRAGEWCQQNGLTPEAIAHLLRAGDFERAADLVAEVAEATLMRSQIATVLAWLEQLPDELVRDRPPLCVYQAWALLMAGRPLATVEERLEEAARCQAEGQDRTAPVRALLALYAGQIARAVELSSWSLEHLPPDDQFLRHIATSVLSLSQLLDGDLASSAEALEAVARNSRKVGNVMVAVSLLCHVGSLRMRQGRLHQARDIYQEALSWATDPTGSLLPVAGEALMGLGRLSFEWNDLQAAARHLIEGIQLTGQWSEVGAMDGYISLAHLRRAEGDFAAAQEAIDRARDLALQTDVTDLDDILVEAHQARLWLAQGNVDAAREWLELRGLLPRSSRPAPPKLSLAGQGTAAEASGPTRVGTPVPSQTVGPAIGVALDELEARVSDDTIISRHRRTAEYATLVRVLLARGHTREALAVLHPLLSIAQRWGLNERVIRFQILRAVAFEAQGHDKKAADALDRAVSLAEPAGYVRPFLDEGKVMQRLLYSATRRVHTADYAGRLLAAFPAEDSASQDRLVDLVEPLSARELEVLRLISEGLSNQQVADRLFISLATVKWHTTNIYGKLGVSNRTQAVAHARTLGLLP